MQATRKEIFEVRLLSYLEILKKKEKFLFKIQVKLFFDIYPYVYVHSCLLCGCSHFV